MKKAFVISYCGTDFHGWQRQENAATVQAAIEDSIEELCGKKTYVSGCGRTDAGVHARYYVASAQLDTNIPDERLPAAINARLPGSVVVHKAVTVDDEFDARFSCVKKQYTYVIHNSRTRNPFLTDRAYFFPQALDIDRMSRACSYIEGTHDFAAFKSEGTPVKSTVRTVFECSAEKRGDMIYIRACADGFLYNMVRTIAGTLIYAGLCKIEPEDIKTILENGAREAAGPCAPACGLYMTKLFYGMEALDGGADF